MLSAALPLYPTILASSHPCDFKYSALSDTHCLRAPYERRSPVKSPGVLGATGAGAGAGAGVGVGAGVGCAG